jgi:hypothetical protein
MGKRLKPYTTRKPPVPSESHAEIEDWIRHVMPDLYPIVKQLDESIRETIPGLRYAIKWKKAYYGVPELGWIIEMVAYDVSVNVVFFGGADFDRPPPLGDTDRSEGHEKTDHARDLPIHESVLFRTAHVRRGSSMPETCRHRRLVP